MTTFEIGDIVRIRPLSISTGFNTGVYPSVSFATPQSLGGEVGRVTEVEWNGYEVQVTMVSGNHTYKMPDRMYEKLDNP